MTTGVSKVASLGFGRNESQIISRWLWIWLWSILWMFKFGAATWSTSVTGLRREFIMGHLSYCVAVSFIFVAELQVLIYL